jgi:hypothetical protein
LWNLAKCAEKLIQLPGQTRTSKVSVGSMSTGRDLQNETEQEDIGSVENTPIGSYAAYERILQNIAQHDVWFAILWIIFAARPLRLQEIVEAMAVDVCARCLDRDSTLNDEEDILEICSSLVDYDKLAAPYLSRNILCRCVFASVGTSISK